MSPKLVIRMFGTFQVERDGVILPEAAWHTQQAKQVLKILLLARGRPVASDRLIEWLWPGANPATTSTTLRSTVHALRRALEPDRAPREPSRYVVTQSPGYAFIADENTWVDLYAFEALLDQAERTRHPGHKRRLLNQALDLYRGDLLEEDLYADWAIVERERVRERYLDALLELAELHAAAGELDRAIAACRRALARDEYREPVYRALMRYQVLAGDVAAALNTYERCRTMLKNEFGAEPAPQTRALYEAILKGELPAARVPAATVTPPPGPLTEGPIVLLPAYELPFEGIFVGREAEREHLRRHITSLAEGKGKTVAVTGEMGMGKTHLVLQVLQHAGEHADVIGTRCLSLEHDLPFAPLTNALRRFLDVLPPERLAELPPFALAQTAQLIPALHYAIPDLPDIPDTTPEENRGRLIDGLTNLIVALSDQRPLVIFLDDVQWADEGTLSVLGRLAYRARRHPLLLVMTYTADAFAANEDLRNLIVHLQHDGMLDEISLSSLSIDDVRRFLAQVWHVEEDTVGALAEHVHHHVEGVPLYLVEVVRELSSRSQGLPRKEDIPPVQTLSHVRALILNRVNRLSPTARDVLHLAAVIGRDIPLDVLETAALNDPLPGLEELLHHRFLREGEAGHVSFVHEVVRHVVYGALPTLARQRLHRQVADALVALRGSQAGPHAVTIAYHYHRAGPRYALPALQFSVLAGDHLRRTYGFRQAREHYRRALQLTSAVLPDTQAQEWIRRAYVGLGLAHEAQGDWEGIVTTYTAMREWAEKHGDEDLVLLAARRLMVALTVVGRLDEAAVTAGEVLAALHGGGDAAVSEVFHRLRLVFGSGHAPDSDEEWPEYLPPHPLAGRPWEDAAGVLGADMAPLPLSLYGWSLALQGMLEEAEACLSYTVSLAEQTAQQAYAILARHFLAHVAFLRDDLRAVQEHLDAGFRLARQAPDATWSTLWGQVFEGYIHLHMGDVAGAQQRFVALDRTLEQRAGFRSHHLSAWVGLTLVSIAQEDVETATALLDRVLAERENLDVVTSFWSRIADAALARRRRDWDRARRRVREALFLAGQRGLLFEYVAAVEEAVRLSVARGTVDASTRALVRQAQALAERRGSPTVLRVVQRLTSRLAGL